MNDVYISNWPIEFTVHVKTCYTVKVKKCAFERKTTLSDLRIQKNKNPA